MQKLKSIKIEHNSAETSIIVTTLSAICLMQTTQVSTSFAA